MLRSWFEWLASQPRPPAVAEQLGPARPVTLSGLIAADELIALAILFVVLGP